jgi:hypothetical protein
VAQNFLQLLDVKLFATNDFYDHIGSTSKNLAAQTHLLLPTSIDCENLQERVAVNPNDYAAFILLGLSEVFKV